MLALAIALGLAPGATAAIAKEPPGQATVTIATLENGTEPEDLARLPISPGVMSAGLGDVPPEQTYLDITQGNRVFDRLYDGQLPVLNPLGTRVDRWREVVDRADSAPADIVPGLLAAASKADQKTVAADFGIVLPALLAADRKGYLLRFGGPGRLDARLGLGKCAAAVCVLDASPDDLRRLLRDPRRGELLIALERPPPETDRHLAIGIAGPGFAGNLTSDSTRTGGYVLSTDVAPTILEHLGVTIPEEMSGEPIRAEGGRDVEEVISLEDRLSEIGDRRGPVIGVSVLIWFAIAALVAAASRGALAGIAIQALALSAVYLPLLLLIGAALEPGQGVERLILAAGSPLLAAATLALLPGYRALAVACALTTLACAVDVLAGSPLTSLSLLGPNPGLGVRFYGIGNELEATLVPLILVGTGATITVLGAGLAPRVAAIVFVGVAFALAFVFAAGSFGADVGAAIVLPAGAAAAAAALGAARSAVLAVVVAPLAALGLLAAFDLALGGDAHLTRSVLDAGGLDELADVAERRLRLSAHSFERAVASPYLWLILLAIGVALWGRRRILAWFAGTPALRAGFIGAAFALVIATLVNDSGVLLLEIGSAYLLLFAGFAWAQARPGTGGEKAGTTASPSAPPA